MIRLISALRADGRAGGARDGPEHIDDQHGHPPPENQGGQEAGGRRRTWRSQTRKATAFWPVYEAYQKELQQINQRLAATIKAYADAYNKGPVTNEAAKKLLDEAMAIDEAEAKLKSATVPKVLAALPATKAARYIQIENKIRAALRYELADKHSARRIKTSSIAAVVELAPGLGLKAQLLASSTLQNAVHAITAELAEPWLLAFSSTGAFTLGCKHESIR